MSVSALVARLLENVLRASGLVATVRRHFRWCGEIGKLNQNYSDSTRDCGGTIATNLTHLQNPGWPSTLSVSSDKTCKYVFSKITSNVCQVRLDFVDFDLGPPISNNVVSRRITMVLVMIMMMMMMMMFV